MKKIFTVDVDAPEILSWNKNPDGSRRVVRAAQRGQVTIEIDLDMLAADLGERALANKSGRAVEASGAVVVKRIN
jgi:hypothetical protein